MIKLTNTAKNKEFYQKALFETLEPLLDRAQAKFLANHLVTKLSLEELNMFLLSPIIVINGEHNERVDNDFIKRQLLKKGNYDALENLNKAKIIICNCENISVVGLDVVYLFGNKIRLISPDEFACFKNEVLLAVDNKVIDSVNIIYKSSVNNAFKNVMHTEFDKVQNTKILNISPTCRVECDIKEMPFKLKRDFEKGKNGEMFTVYNPTEISVDKKTSKEGKAKS